VSPGSFERPVLRAVQTGDPALLRRAEAAEATVQTLETHLSSLQQRLREVEETCRHSAQRLAASENELRRVKQQEYAEQQLRVEAERALAVALDRSSGVFARSEIVQRLQARVAEVERRAEQLAEEIESERRARERSERALAAMRESHAAMAAIVGELRDVARKLRDGAALAAGRPTAATTALAALATSPAPSSSQVRREEMADALAAAVERLRARAEEEEGEGEEPQSPVASEEGEKQQQQEEGEQEEQEEEEEEEPVAATPALGTPSVGASPTGMPGPLVVVSAGVAARENTIKKSAGLPTADEPSGATMPAIPPKKPHKHSMSLIGRLRYARKQRREGR
jgi:hypothetical protein